MSQGVDTRLCLPKTAWPSDLDGKMAIDKVMVEKTIVKAGIKVFYNAYLEGMHAGYPSIVRTLLEEGEILLGKSQNNEIEDFFLTFPYFTIKPSEEAVDCNEILFDKEMFIQSDSFRIYIKKEREKEMEEMERLKEEIKEREERIIESRLNMSKLWKIREKGLELLVQK